MHLAGSAKATRISLDSYTNADTLQYDTVYCHPFLLLNIIAAETQDTYYIVEMHSLSC